MYFAHFPIIQYTLGETDDNGRRKWRVMRDITVRARFIEEHFKQRALYRYYVVHDNSTPDDVATEVYGDPHYHWVVLLSNDIIDPRKEWVWPEDRVQAYTFVKYWERSDIKRFTYEKYKGMTEFGAEEGMTIDEILDLTYSSDLETRKTVLDYEMEENARLSKLPHVREEVMAACHHFEDADGDWVQEGTEGAIMVSNLLFEMRENDKKKEIRLLDPRHLQSFLQEFARIMK